MSFADVNYAGNRKQRRRERFLIEMIQFEPGKGLIALVEQHYLERRRWSSGVTLIMKLRVPLVRNWFGYCEPAMKQTLYETGERSLILRQRTTLVTLIYAPSSTTDKDGERDLELLQIEKNNQYCFDFNISVDDVVRTGAQRSG